jgi:hypothetical protein
MTVRREPSRPIVIGGTSALEWGCIGLVFFALLSHGANTTLPFVICFWLAAGLCLASLLLLGRPEKTRCSFLLCMDLYLALAMLTGLQTLPLPAPLAAPIWVELSRAGIEGGRNSITLAPAETLAGWLRLALPFLAFLSALTIFRTDDRAEKAFRLIAEAGGILAGFCLLEFLLAPATLLFAQKPHEPATYSLTFVNRNTAATALGLLALMLGTGALQEWRRLDRRRLVAWILNGVPLGSTVRLRAFLLPACLLLVVLICLALTKSRGGIFATAVAAVLMLALLGWHRDGMSAAGFSSRRRSVWRRAGRIGISLLCVLAAVAVFAPRAILRQEMEGTGDGRFCILDGLLSAARDNWLTGSGFGAFPFAFAPYRDPACGIRAIWDKAHNVFLEGFIGLGILFVPVLVIGLWGLLGAYRAGLVERRDRAVYPIAGLAGLCLVSVHGLSDFSLQIPGFAVLYAVFAALTVTISLGRHRQQAEALSHSGRPPAWTFAFAGIVLFSLALAAMAARDAIAAAATRTFARALDAGTPVDTAALTRLVEAGLPSRRLETCNGLVLRASLTVLLAHLDRADRTSDYEAWAQRHGAAERQVSHALTCLPADGNLWLRLAMLRQAAGEVPSDQAALMALAQQRTPAERRQLVGRLAQWNRLSPATLALAREDAVSDVRNGLNFLAPDDVGLALAAPSPAMLGLIREVLPLVPAERREALRKSGLDWVSDRDGTGPAAS